MFLHREQAKNMTNSQSDQGIKPKSVAYWQPTLTIDIMITVLLWLTFRGDRVACDVNQVATSQEQWYCDSYIWRWPFFSSQNK